MMYKMKRILVLIGFALTVSCGYHLGAGPVSPAKFGAVAVPIFVNESKEPNIQAVVTNAIILKLNQAGVLVVDVDQADKILEGRILSYKNTSVARTVASTVSEYRLSAKISLVLKDRTGQSLYHNPSAQLREEYFASVILEQNEKAEAEAQQRGAIDFAEDQVRHMLDHITSGLGNDRL
jgi:outer membrane lipopolysaccharide assembly protein LptE/RlpB